MVKTKTKFMTEKTRWAYYMQAIEPHDQALLKAFPDYHPMWVIQSQEIQVTGARFKYMRETLLGMSVDECAAYLRLDRGTVYRYERDGGRIPFSAFELLRVLYESPQFKMGHQSWDGWYINKDGKLVCPDVGNLSFSPNDLASVRHTHSYNKTLCLEVKRLTRELQIANEKLLRFQQNQIEAEILEELIELEQALSAISSRIGKSKVVSLKFAKNQIAKEKAA
ncbi:DUF3653 domain-containing protein [Methylophilus sp. YYY-1]|uniref:DUF3653 domain-containing protein n=1 Tax=Methylophilus sp. YYY-1 TaxID=2682087 RepID=UPI0023B32B01|nr:DUF3653 domain-containing protein [Methylophilus sp. YYY-1]MDF0379368.1 hypothetical protein [Methylophilus sp. YYY-1]